MPWPEQEATIIGQFLHQCVDLADLGEEHDEHDEDDFADEVDPWAMLVGMGNELEQHTTDGGDCFQGASPGTGPPIASTSADYELLDGNIKLTFNQVYDFI